MVPNKLTLFMSPTLLKSTRFINDKSPNLSNESYQLCFFLGRDHLQISLLLLRKFKGINKILFPLKLSENLQFFDDFRGNKN